MRVTAKEATGEDQGYTQEAAGEKGRGAVSRPAEDDRPGGPGEKPRRDARAPRPAHVRDARAHLESAATRFC